MTNEQFAYWLAGLCDGEAHFNVTLATSTAGRVAGSPRFALTLRDDDRAALELAHERAGVGTIRIFSHQRARDAGRPWRDAVCWEVTGPSCAVIARLLAGKMQTKKAREFEVWAEAVLRSVALPGRYHPDRAPLMLETRERLMELRRYPETKNSTAKVSIPPKPEEL